jgi:hypothetical protein
VTAEPLEPVISRDEIVNTMLAIFDLRDDVSAIRNLLEENGEVEEE